MAALQHLFGLHVALQTWLFIILPCATAMYWIIWIIYTRSLHPLNCIPGPFWASVSRIWYMAQILKGDVEHTQRKLHEKYGPLIRIAPNEIVCADPDAIKKIYPTKNPLSKTDFYPVWGNPGISKYPDLFSGTDERLHSARRRIVNHVYSLSNVLRSEEYLDRCSQLFIQRLREHAEQGKSINLGEWLQMFTFDVIGEVFFGRMFGFMENSHDHAGYIHSLDTLTLPLAIVAVAPTYARPFILGSAVAIPAVRKALKAIGHIKAAAISCVAERTRPIPERGGLDRADLLQQLLDIRREKGEQVDFGIHEVELEAYVAMFAGSDTTAIAFRAVFYYLMKHPAAYSTLLVELDTAAAAGELSDPVQYSEAIRLPFLCATIKEAMRLHPSVGFTMPRIVPAGGMELCGKFIPAGYRVGCNGAVVHYDQGVFGSDAARFRPERWLEADAGNMEKYLIHFGHGTRTCIGKNISIAELHKLIPQVLRHFELEMDHKQPWTTRNFWFNKQSNLIVRLKQRL